MGHGLGDLPPPLAPGCDYHLFFSKHERYGKETAEIVKMTLDSVGFTGWLSREQDAVNEAGMRDGVTRSEVLFLVATHGIFAPERHWVTHVELKTAIDQGKSVNVLNKK